jgi:formylglycine-generating enzyme required for sulfatase activity
MDVIFIKEGLNITDFKYFYIYENNLERIMPNLHTNKETLGFCTGKDDADCAANCDFYVASASSARCDAKSAIEIPGYPAVCHSSEASADRRRRTIDEVEEDIRAAGLFPNGRYCFFGPFGVCEVVKVAPAADDMVFVQGGTFKMGGTSEQGEDCDDDEMPVHDVTVSDFYIGKYPVTQRQWTQVMGTNPSKFLGDDFPVETVSWNDVQEFIEKLNKQTGQSFRLPTEAEWEYAASGGNQSKGYKYSGSDNVDEVAWYRENSGGKTHPVGTKLPNELGIYDMSGNVSEWVNDWYGKYTAEAQENPQGPSEGDIRIKRGGHYITWAIGCRVSDRPGHYPDTRNHATGFRLALEKYKEESFITTDV